MPILWVMVYLIVFFVWIMVMASFHHLFILSSESKKTPSFLYGKVSDSKSFIKSSSMICGLFSSFDPSIVGGSEELNYKWVFIVSILLFLSWQTFSKEVGISPLFTLTVKVLFKVTTEMFKNPKGLFILSVSTFMFFMIMNLSGLIPYFFSLSSHCSVTLSLSIPLWVGGMLVALKSFYKLMSHMVPQGSPYPLLPLLVVVETVSTLIRPMTLGIRLMANMMAGHMILSLMSTFLSSKAVFLSPMIVGGFMAFESCVSVVQAFVFLNLLLMYWKESE